MSKRIGIVLAAVPSYSETFLRSKIIALIKNGARVFLFIPYSNSSKIDGAKVINHWPVKFLDIRISFFLQFLYLFLWRPQVIIKFIKFELKDGFTLRKIVKNIYINGSILSLKLDWLHFGFATLTNRRENVAKAIGAAMGVSIRGFDVCLTPLRNPKMYDNLWNKRFRLHYLSDDLLHKATELGCPESIDKMKITPAIDYPEFSNPDKTTSTFNSPLRILTVSRLHWKKGLEYAMDALGLLNKQRVQFRYTIIGSGAEYERLCYAAFQNKITNKVKFIGKKDHDFVKRAMLGNDIFLMPSVSEGFCNAVLEAQAAGLFCIVTDAEGLTENILDQKTGWVVPKRDPVAMSTAIMEVLNMDPARREKISLNAMKRIKEEFNLEIYREKWNSFFTS